MYHRRREIDAQNKVCKAIYELFKILDGGWAFCVAQVCEYLGEGQISMNVVVHRRLSSSLYLPNCGLADIWL